ncbi:PepSY domain-containing protein [Limoniibacter endophyticus]|uniref:PepSY domain-containing protein n=1 Tax=Limoniibacter endophyticus TaxID=1565040 RepID=A0A8J3GHY2_9HYPH|nr:PepSY domain-containing protein [Limoniibacter endophyticus]GHC77952.1 hypothetical protein GCM10010136_29520 [Limoniibacter endophyticus]
MSMTRTLVLAAAFTTFAAAAVPAYAGDDDRCGRVPRGEWMSVEEIARKAAADGYRVTGVDADDGCWQVEGIDQDGHRVEVDFHPVSGAVVYIEYDD